MSVVYITFSVGCGTVPKRTPVPKDLINQAKITGIPQARYWGDEAPPWTDQWFALSQEEIEARHPEIIGKEHTYLALSGGGANGAFAAGLLNGWTEAGDRPEFSMVTGISTGALIAPFAFLGPDYDAQVKEIYTGVSTKDIIKERSLLVGLNSDALASTKPLEALIKKYVTKEMMEAIAAEFRKGRELDMATTNLDAGRPVIWNITRIAASGNPKALDLIHDIMRASAAIPVAFPPVLFEVEANGQRYDEMHVDGGGAAQVFLYPIGIDWRRVEKKLKVKGTPKVYLIRNSRLAPSWKAVEARVPQIAGRTIDSLIRTQGIGDMYRVYLGTKRDGLDYHLAYIPDAFDEQQKEPFDPEYMTKLFNVGYQMAKNGYPWRKYPPGAELQ